MRVIEREGCIIFFIQNAWKYIAYHKYNSVILIAALTLGFLFPMLSVSDVNDLIRDGEVSRYEEASQVAVIEYLTQYKEEEEIDAAINACIREGMFDSAGYFFTKGLTVRAKEAFYAGGICAVSEGYLPIAGYELVDGVVFSGEDYAAGGERVCLLEYGGALARNGVGVGDVVEIAGNAYRVKGIVRAPRTYGGVLLPYAAVSALPSQQGGRLQYRILTYGETEAHPMQIASGLFPLETGNLILAQTGMQEEEVYYDSLWSVNRYRIQRAAIVIVFAGINILFLFAGMIAREKYDMAVRTALGAGRKTLWAESLARNLQLVLISFLLAAVLYPSVSAMITRARDLQFRTLLQVGVSGTALVVLVDSIVLFLCFRKRDIAGLLKG